MRDETYTRMCSQMKVLCELQFDQRISSEIVNSSPCFLSKGWEKVCLLVQLSNARIKQRSKKCLNGTPLRDTKWISRAHALLPVPSFSFFFYSSLHHPTFFHSRCFIRKTQKNFFLLNHYNCFPQWAQDSFIVNPLISIPVFTHYDDHKVSSLRWRE